MQVLVFQEASPGTLKGSKMAGDFNAIDIAGTVENVFAAIHDTLVDVAKMFDATNTLNPPVGAVAWSSANLRWEKFDGVAWNELSSGYYINVLKLQGLVPGNAAGQIPVNNYITCAGLSAQFLSGQPSTFYASQQYVDATLAAKAPIANPSFAGTVLVPAPAWDDQSNRAATMLNVWTVANWILSTGAFPSGTRMLFQQSTAPTGWVKETNPAYNDRDVRIVTGNITNGGVHPYSSVFAYRTSDGTAITEAQMPPHFHTYTKPVTSGLWQGGSVSTPTAAVDGQPTSSVGSGQPHTHTYDMRVLFIDVIIATKV